jgi:hypothetical protein
LRPFGRKRRKSHPALRCHGADVVHCISILREVTASTKRLLQRQQRRRPEKQRLCLVPHTMPFSWTAIRWVVEPRVYSAAVFASVRLWEHNVGKVPRKPLFVAYVLCLTQSFDSGGISISFGVISFWRTAASRSQAWANSTRTFLSAGAVISSASRRHSSACFRYSARVCVAFPAQIAPKTKDPMFRTGLNAPRQAILMRSAPHAQLREQSSRP